MQVPDDVKRLVETFVTHKDFYQSLGYKEAEVRLEFVDPLFKALGWDVRNEKGLSVVNKEVIVEESLEVEGATKAPDYCFRIGGDRKFFVEAKKPSIPIDRSIYPAFQLRRYGWSAGLPISILTDFEEFAIYDCSAKPIKTDSPTKARLDYLTYVDYEKKWEELISTFSRDAIENGSLDEYVPTKQRGGSTTVDKEFLKEIELWRDKLAKNIALINPGLTVRELNYAVQVTIDRIIFLRICEDRGIEDYEQLKKLIENPNVYSQLCVLFQRADERYNSGLFYFQKERDRTEPPDELSLILNIDDKHLTDIIGRLYYPDSPYEFSVLPADILGQVYEQFLGKVIRLTPSHQAKVEEKPDVRKAGGVYYTPTYIVDYIVENTVCNLLEGMTPKEASNIRILDPACGSGSFLIVAYQYLLDWHREWYANNNPEKLANKRNPCIRQIADNDWSLTTSEKKRILLNNIYGVDIDSQAVEVTKLSLLLKVLEGENEQTVARQLFYERALPDLSNNIKCGNSIVESDFYDNQQIALFDEEKQYQINVFDWKSEFPEIMNSGGFNAVIGNPPYITYSLGRGRVKHDSEEIDYISKRYVNSSEYKINSFAVFYEKALQLCRTAGLCAFIVPGTILINKALSRIRSYLLLQGYMYQVVSLNYRVFADSQMGDCAILFVKNSPQEKYEIDLYQYNSEDWKKDVLNNTVSSEAVSEISGYPIYVKSQVYSFLKIGEQANVQSLGTVARFYNGIKTGNNKKYLSEQKSTDKHSLVIRGRDFYRYGKPKPTTYVYFEPEVLWSNTDIAKLGANDKIIIRQTGDRIIATIDTTNTLCMDTVHMIYETTLNRKYLLGLLNSKFLNYYHRCLVPEGGKAFAEIKISNLKKLPIPDIGSSKSNSEALNQRVVILVEQMLELNEQLVKAKTPNEITVLQRNIDTNDRQIDKLVYELYGLTEEEISIVENASK